MSVAGPRRAQLLTIGHSVLELPRFLASLALNSVTAVADVRSKPYSRFNPAFNRESLAAALKAAGIAYVFLGEELGARRAEPEAYRAGQARYDLIRTLPAFARGLDRVRRGIETHRLALMCAEKDPLTCHRTILVCRAMRDDSLDIAHILDDGSIESSEQAERRLLGLMKISTDDLFSDYEGLVQRAYDLQSERIAYSGSRDEQAEDEA